MNEEAWPAGWGGGGGVAGPDGTKPLIPCSSMWKMSEEAKEDLGGEAKTNGGKEEEEVEGDDN